VAIRALVERPRVFDERCDVRLDFIKDETDTLALPRSLSNFRQVSRSGRAFADRAHVETQNVGGLLEPDENGAGVRDLQRLFLSANQRHNKLFRGLVMLIALSAIVTFDSWRARGE